MTRRRIITRVIVFVLLLIAGGAIVNVAVAWGCAAYLYHFFDERFLMRAPFPTTVLDSPCGYDFKYDGDTPEPYEFGIDGYYLTYTRDVRRYGLPCLAVQSIVYGYADRGGWVGGWDLPWKQKLLRGYPTQRLPQWVRASPHDRLAIVPLWPGFAINTIFYAAALWLVFCAAPGFVRRRIGRRRGRCLHCGYDLRGQRPGAEAGASRKCPECGRSA